LLINYVKYQNELRGIKERLTKLGEFWVAGLHSRLRVAQTCTIACFYLDFRCPRENSTRSEVTQNDARQGF